MSYDEVADKFRGCAEFAKWPTAKGGRRNRGGEVARDSVRHEQTRARADELKVPATLTFCVADPVVTARSKSF